MENINQRLRGSVDSVISDDKLLKEILVKLPITSLLSFETVSKRWLSFIKDTKLTQLRGQISKVDPPRALFIKKTTLPLLRYDFLFVRDRSRFLDSGFGLGDSRFDIVQSCNGLVLCCSGQVGQHRKFYVANPTLSISKTFSGCKRGGVRVVFDPVKSSGYKLFHAESRDSVNTRVRVYLSEVDGWIDCAEVFLKALFTGFGFGVYWNDAIHWVNIVHGEMPTHYSLGYVNGHAVLTNVSLPMLHFELHSDIKLIASGGCLLLLCWDYEYVDFLGIYELKQGCTDWAFKYFVDLTPQLRGPNKPYWRIRKNAMCIVVGEREEDSFMLIELSGKVIEYAFRPKDFRTLCHLGSRSATSCVEFIPSYARV